MSECVCVCECECVYVCGGERGCGGGVRVGMGGTGSEWGESGGGRYGVRMGAEWEQEARGGW